jgi:hypothetical protein
MERIFEMVRLEDFHWGIFYLFFVMSCPLILHGEVIFEPGALLKVNKVRKEGFWWKVYHWTILGWPYQNNSC